MLETMDTTLLLTALCLQRFQFRISPHFVSSQVCSRLPLGMHSPGTENWLTCCTACLPTLGELQDITQPCSAFTSQGGKQWNKNFFKHTENKFKPTLVLVAIRFTSSHYATHAAFFTHVQRSTPAAGEAEGISRLQGSQTKRTSASAGEQTPLIHRQRTNNQNKLHFCPSLNTLLLLSSTKTQRRAGKF